MERKRKISFRKVFRFLLTLTVSAGSIAAILSASKKQDAGHIKNIHFTVTNEAQYQFLDKKTVEHDLITKNNIVAGSTVLSAINATAIEAMALKNPWVAKAQVYLDNQRDLHINLTQRIPAARVFFENGKSCYLDTALHVLPLSPQFSYYTTVVTNLPEYNNDSSNRRVRGQVVSLVNYVDHHPFWRGQIEHIAVTPDGKFEMYPLLGSHRIIFGDTTMMAAKFDRLFGFYKNVLNKIGWDKYRLLDLRYRGQIIASPSLPWKKPPANAMSNMSWLQNILDEAPKTEHIEMQASAQQTIATAKPTISATTAATPASAKPKQETAATQASKTVRNKKTETTTKPAAPVIKASEKKPPPKTEHKENTTPKYIYQDHQNQ